MRRRFSIVAEIISLTVLILLAACENDNTPITAICDKTAVLSQDSYFNDSSDQFMLDSVWLSGNCISIAYKYRGGCGETEMNLVGSFDPAFNLPDGVSAKLLFEDQDYCKALISDTVSFDVTPYILGNKPVILKIEGWEKGFVIGQ